MSDDSTTHRLLYPGIFHKPVIARFDQREGSSDGGALLLKAADRHYGLVARWAACLRVERQPAKGEDWFGRVVGLPVSSMARGYAGGNDSARLAADPVNK